MQRNTLVVCFLVFSLDLARFYTFVDQFSPRVFAFSLFFFGYYLSMANADIMGDCRFRQWMGSGCEVPPLPPPAIPPLPLSYPPSPPPNPPISPPSPLWTTTRTREGSTSPTYAPPSPTYAPLSPIVFPTWSEDESDIEVSLAQEMPISPMVEAPESPPPSTPPHQFTQAWNAPPVRRRRRFLTARKSKPPQWMMLTPRRTLFKPKREVCTVWYTSSDEEE